MDSTTRHATTVDTPLGPLLIVATEDGSLVEAAFEGTPPPGAALDTAATAEAARQLRAYFTGDLDAFDLDLAPQGTPFQREVWRALGEIPHGQTVSYGALAARVGRPRGAQAVGRANGQNPIAVVVPCHRVVGADGALVGYAGGLDRKAALLAHEGAAVVPPTLFDEHVP